MSAAAAMRVDAFRPLLAAALLIAFICSPHAIAEDPPTVRRVYVPADRVAELGAQFPELRTLSRQEFDELLRRAQNADSPVLPLIETARYEARLDGDVLVGTGEFAARGRADARSLLRWPASSWRITQAKWAADDASLGYAGHGQLGLVVPAGDSHTLSFAWSAPTRLTEGGRRFEIELPPSLRAELTLDLPLGLAPSVAGAQIAGPTDAPRPELKRWSVRWSPASSIRMLLVQEGGPRQPAAQIFYDRELDADVSDDGTELIARFSLSVAHQPIRRIEIEHSLGVHVYSWSGVKVHDWEARDDRLVLELAEPLDGDVQLVVRALATGPSSVSWQLPRLEIAGGHWTGGTTRVRAAAGLNLYDVRVAHGRVAGRLSSDGARPEFVIEHATPEPGLTARASFARPQIFARVHSTLQFTPRPELTAAVRWQVGAGEVSLLRMRVPPEWVVHDVDVGSGLLQRWTVETNERGAVLNLRLNRPQSEDGVVNARVSLRGPQWDATTNDAALRLPRLEPLDVHAAEETIAVEQSPDWSFEVDQSTELTPVPRVTLGDVNPTRPPAATYRFDGPEASGRLAIHRQPPQVTCEIDTAVEIDEDVIRAKYVIDVEFLSGTPEPLDVTFSAAVRESLTWELPAGVRVEPVDVAAEPAAGKWRVVSRSAARRIRLAANWRIAATGSAEIPLPTVAQSSATTGDVSVSAPNALVVAPSVEGLVPLAAPPSSVSTSHQRPPARELAWRYGAATPRLQIQVSKDPHAAADAAWIARTDIRTEMDANGDTIHGIRYFIHGPAGAAFSVKLPGDATLRRARSSDGAITRLDSGELRAVRSSARGAWQVFIEYSERGRGLGRWAERDFALPRASLLTLRTSWEILPPPGYEPVVWSNDLISAPPHAGRSPFARLFGPLARRSDDEPFRFWTIDAWQSWWERRTGARPDSVEDRLEAAIREFIRDVRPRDRTWARLLEHIEQFTERPLVADLAALDVNDVDFNATVLPSVDAAENVLDRVASDPSLALLRTPRGLLVTSRAEADAIGEVERGSTLRRLNDRGGLLEAVDQALLNGADSSGRFGLLGRRLLRAKETAGDGSRGVDSGSSQGEPPWRFDSAAELTVVSVTFVQSRLVDQTTAIVVALAIALACVVRPSTGRLRAGAFGLVSGIGVALALTLPEAISPPAAALAWSLLAVAIFSGRRASRSAIAPDAAAKLPSTLAQAATGAIILVLLWPACPSSGQTELEKTPSPRDSLVFIPYDPEHPEKRHEATRVLVPRALHERLVQAGGAADEIERLVLIRSALYTAELQDDGARLSVEFDLENLAAEKPARCSLPLAGFLLRQAQLDGEPCLLRPEPDGFSVEVSRLGLHRLRLEGAVAIDIAAVPRAIDLPIPPVPSAKFVAVAPPGSKFELDGVAGPNEFRESPEGVRFQANLSGSSRLRVRWGREVPPPAVVHADSAFLWTWAGAAPQLHARLHVSVEGGPIARLALEPDARLILKRVQAPDLAGVWLRPAAEVQQLVLEFDRPITRAVTVDLEFVMRDDATGKIVLPDVRLQQVRTGARLFALRTDADHKLLVADALRATADEFQSVWGESVAPSDGVAFVRLGADAPPPAVEKILVQAPTRLRTQVDVQVGRGRIETVSRVAIVSTAGKSFRQELLLPPGTTLGNVRASPGTQWSEITADRLLWFGAVPEHAAPTIDVEIWTPLEHKDQSLPLVRPAGELELTGDLVLWRSRDTRLALDDSHGLTPANLRGDLKPPAAEFVPEAAYTIDSADCAATLSVGRHPLTLSASVATRLTVDDDDSEWVAVVEYQIVGGAIDTFELRLPASIRPPLEVEGEGIRQRTVRTDGAEQVWRIHLLEPRWSGYRILIRMRVANAAGGLNVPIVRPLGVTDARHYLLIQNATDQRLEVRGVDGSSAVAADMFGRWFSEPVTNNVAASVELRELAEPIVVRAAETPEPATSPASILERHRAWIRPTDATLVRSVVLFQPRSGGEAVLRLPRSASVLELRLDGHAIQPITNADGDTVMNLEPGFRPHEVTVLWRWRELPQSRGTESGEIRLTRLTDSACPSVWTLHVPEQVSVRSVTPKATSHSLAAATEAQVIADEIERMLPLPKGVDSAERGEVVWDLERSFLVAVFAARRSLEVEAELGLPTRELRAAHDRAAAQLGQMLDQNRQLLDRSGLGSLLARSEAQVQRTSSPRDAIIVSAADGANEAEPVVDRPAHAFEPPNGKTIFAVTDSDVALAYRASKPSATASIAAVGAAGLAGSFVCVLLTVLRTRRWLASLAFLGAGVAWCWWLQPQPLGVALLGVAVLAAIGRFAARRMRTSASAHLTP